MLLIKLQIRRSLFYRIYHVSCASLRDVYRYILFLSMQLYVDYAAMHIVIGMHYIQ